MPDLLQSDVPPSQSEAVGDGFLFIVHAHYHAVALHVAARRLGGALRGAAATQVTGL